MKIRASTIPYMLLVILLLLFSGAFLWLTQKNPYIADTMGYVIAGKALAAGNGLSFFNVLNETAGPFFAPFAFQIRHENISHLFLGFPPGFPILLAAGILLTGQSGFVFYVVPILAILSLILTFLLGKFVSENAWNGLIATIFVAIAPILWHFGTDAWAAVPSMVFTLTGILFYVGSRQEKRPLSYKILFSIIAALLLIFSLYIRYANITYLLAIGLTELLTARLKLWQEKWRWPFYILLGVGLLSILAFNQTYYGGLTLTSYSPENGWYIFPPFSLAYAFGPSPINGYSFLEAMKTLWHNFPVILLLTPIGWFTLKRPYGLLFALSTLSTIAIYSIYAFAPEGENSRFLLPLLPFIAVSITSALTTLVNKIHNPSIKIAILVGLIAILTLLFIPDNIQETRTSKINTQNGRIHLENWIGETPEDAVFLSYSMNDHIIYYGNRSVLNYRRIPQYDPALNKIRYDIFEPCIVYLIDTLLTNDIPVIYIEDGNPPLYNSYILLQNYYQLEPLREEPKLHQIHWQENATIRGDKSVCSP